MFGRNKIAMVVAEFLGTFALASAFLAMVYNRLGVSYFQATAVGVTFLIVTLMFSKVETGYYNPAVTIGLWTLRKIETAKAVVFIAAQALGGVVAWTLGQYLFDTTFQNIANQTTDWRLFTAEAIGAAILAMGVAAVVNNKFNDIRDNVTLAGALAVGMMVASFAGNGIVNPAVAVSLQSWSFAYVAGPVLGVVLGINIYQMLFGPAPVKRSTASTKKKVTTKKKATTKKRK